MAGLNNNSNPFQNQVRIGPQYIQLVPGPPGPAGNGALTVQWNDGAIIQRGTLDLVGFGYVDDAGSNRMRFFAGNGIGAQIIVAAGSSGTLANGLVAQTMIIDTTGARATRTFPAAPTDGDVVRATFTGASNNNGAAFVANSGQTIADPQNPGTFSATAGTVVSFTPGDHLGWFYQAASTRWVLF
jgi:hypothetical protein